MKVINIINGIYNGENMPLQIKVDGDIYKWDTLEHFYSRDDGSDLLELSKEFDTVIFLDMEVEIIEDEEIDIDSIEELSDTYSCYHHNSETQWSINEQALALKINDLIKAVKQLNKKIKEKE